ncbi:MAG TPA: lipocalin-like domain-containing protein [Pyrinomonadaceae bacterium]|nr:lipocalin-like domain-containing protein [Pyrinomonadaceae bacterium]
MFRILKGLTLLVLCTIVVSAQSSTKKPIEGAWKVTEIVVTGENESNVPNPQPGLIIFTQKHYSAMWVPGNQPRTLFKGDVPTNEEKIAAYDSFVANSGTYEVDGATLTLHPMVARSPNFMAGGVSKYQLRIEGTTLWLTQKNTDLSVRSGDRVAPSSGPVSEIRLKFSRVE